MMEEQHDDSDDSEAEASLDLESLRVESRGLGIEYLGTDKIELFGLIQLARAQKGRNHPVPCFGMSHDPTDRRCRICQLRNPCADADGRPRVIVVETRLSPISCEVCGKGMLEIELLDPETKQLRDYACSNTGCSNRISIQCGWETADLNDPEDIALGEEEPIEKPSDPADDPKSDADDEEEPAEAEDPSDPPKIVKPLVVKLAPAPAKKAPVVKQARNKVSANTPAKKVKAGSLVYVCDKTEYSSLSTLVSELSGGGRAWSPKKFFSREDLKDLRPGDVLRRTWKGRDILVEVKQK